METIYLRGLQKNDSYNEKSHTITVQEAYKFTLKPAFRIVELRPGSPAEIVGLMLGDVILSINNKDVNHLKMQERLIHFLGGEDGKLIKLKIERDGVLMRFNFKLKSML